VKQADDLAQRKKRVVLSVSDKLHFDSEIQNLRFWTRGAYAGHRIKILADSTLAWVRPYDLKLV